MACRFPWLLVLGVLCACGGRIQSDPSGDGADGSSSSGSGPGASTSSGGSGGGASGGGFGNGSPGSSGSASSGDGAGNRPPPPSLMLGQCLLGATGGPSFPETLGVGAGILGASGRADTIWCEATSDAGYRLELRPTRDPELSTHGTLVADGESLGDVSCKLTPYEDDTNVYYASFDCTLPPHGEDLPGTRVTGAIYVRPIPDTLK